MEGRKKPFTEFERSFLLNLIQQNAAIIENKKADSVSSNRKNAAWTRIVEEYNASKRISQKVDMKQIKKFWNNMKLKLREVKTIENQRNFTGGGSAIPDMDPENALTLGNVTHILPVVKMTDSDAVNIQEDDDDSQYWTCKKRIQESEEKSITQNIKQTQEEESVGETIAARLIETPGLSEIQSGNKRLRLQSTEGSTDPVENLKIKLLEQDLKHQEERFEIEIKHLKEIQELDRQMKAKEMKHKSKMYQLIEEEMKLKIEILKNNKLFN